MAKTMVNHAISASAGRRRRFTFLAGSMLALHGSIPAFGQAAPPAPATPQAISIPAGPLTPALNRLAAQAGLQILFDAGLTRGKTTRGVRGALVPEQALDRLLAGTGISGRFAGSTQVVLTGNPAPEITGALPDDTISLDEIRIYGARDATTLQNTSASVGIVTARDIEYGQIHNFRDAFRRMANVMDADWINGGFVLRGVNSEGFASGNNPIGSLYIDGVLQTQEGTRRGARALWDTEQVEVYRGPQSTLSGRAAMAGAIYIRTKDPTFKREVEVQGTIGNDRRVGAAFMVNAPLLENQVAARIAGSFERFRSDLNAPSFVAFQRYDEWMTDSNFNIRGKLLITPTGLPDTKAMLSYSFAQDAPRERDIGGPGMGLPWRQKRSDFYLPIYTEVRSTRVNNLGLEVTHNFSDALRFTSQTGISHDFHQRPSINLGTYGESNVLRGDRTSTQFTQEFRLNYDLGPWKWVAGIYGSHLDWRNWYDGRISTTTISQKDSKKTANAAAFGELTYEFAPSWKVIAGARLDYTDQSVDYYYRRGNLRTGAAAITRYSGSTDELNFLPKLGISNDFGDRHTAGFVYSQGFRNGGIAYDNIRMATYTYDPEKSHNFELFYKGRWLDDRLTVNANLFHTRFRRQQVDIEDFVNLNNLIANAANSRSWGFEIEPYFRVTDQFTTFASIGYLDTKFDRKSQHGLIELAGYPFPEAPEWSLGIGGRYEFGNGLYVGADAKYTSRYMARFSVNAPNSFVGDRTIVNAQAGYKRESWEVNAFAQNLLDEKYLTYLDGDSMATLGQGRSFGVSVKAKF